MTRILKMKKIIDYDARKYSDTYIYITAIKKIRPLEI